MRRSDPEYDRIRSVDTFVAELVRARKERGLTQAQVAEAAGIRQSHVSRIENFESERVAFETIVRYAHAIGFKLALIDMTAGLPSSKAAPVSGSYRETASRGNKHREMAVREGQGASLTRDPAPKSKAESSDPN